MEATQNVQDEQQLVAINVTKHLGIVQSAKKVSELVDELVENVENKLRDGASARYVKDLRSRLKIFAASFPEISVIDLSTAVIDDWLRNLPHSGTTRNNYRRLVSVLFRYGIRRGYCLENPAQKASRARVVDKPPGILTPEQCVRLLQAADSEVVPGRCRRRSPQRRPLHHHRELPRSRPRSLCLSPRRAHQASLHDQEPTE